MINKNFENSSNQDEESFNIKNQISYYLFFWPWFLFTLVVALLGSYLYLRYTPNIYQSSAQIQITKSDASSSFLSTEITTLFGTRINVQNDISVIKSNHILSKVVKHLDFQTSIFDLFLPCKLNTKGKSMSGSDLKMEFRPRSTSSLQRRLRASAIHIRGIQRNLERIPNPMKS